MMLPQHLLEKNKKPELKFVDLSSDPFGVYRGHGIEVGTAYNRYIGVYQGLTLQGKAILAPHLSFVPAIEKKGQPFWNEHPQFIEIGAIVTITPQSRENLRNILSENNSDADPACLI